MQDSSISSNIITDPFKVVANVSHAAIYDWNLKTQETWRSKSFFELFGFANEITNFDYKFWEDKVHEEDRNRVIAGMNAAMDNKQMEWSDKYRFMRADGHYAHVVDRASIIYEKDEPVRIIGSMIDISPDIKLQQINEEWEERNRLALDATELGTWVLDPINKLINWDNRCQQLYGFKSGEVIGYDELLSHIYVDDRPFVENAVQQALTKAGNYNLEFRTIDAETGKARWLRCKGKAYFNSRGIAYRFAGTAQDITEEKRKDEALKDIEQKYQSGFDNASQGIVIVGLNGRFLLVNKAFAKMTGYTADELYSDTFEDITFPDDLELSREVIRKLVSGEHRSQHFHKRYRRKDGSVFWANVQTTVTLDSYGLPASFFTIVQDISSEIASTVQQQKLLTLIDNSVELMSILELNGTNSYLNRAGREMLGFDSDEQVLHTPIADLHNPEDLAFVQTKVVPTVMSEGRWSGSMMVKHLKTSEVFPVYNNSLRIDDPRTGEPLAIGAIMRDLRPEMLAREALVKSETRFRNMISNAPVAIGVLKGDDFIIETANVPLLNIWGRGSEVIGKPLLECIPELVDQPFPHLLREVYRTGVDYHAFEYKGFIRRNGKLEECYFNFVYSAIREDEDLITGVMLVALEVSSQVKAKKELQQSEFRFRDLVMNAPMPIAVYVGLEMRIQLANDEVLKTWDKDRSVIGKTFRETLPELEGQGFNELLEHVYTTGETYQATEDRVDLFVNGRIQTFYFNFTYKALRDGEGNIYGVINTATDVTQFVQARQNLKKTEEQLRIAVESAEMGTWSLDFQRKVIHYSERMRSLLGVTTQTESFQEALLHIHESDRERARIVMRKQLLSNNRTGVYRDEFTLVNRASNRDYIVRAVGKVFLDEEGNANVAIGTVQDITAQKMTEQELEKQVELRTGELRELNDSLLRSNQELEQFAYVASHDLQEPLRKIRMFSDLLGEPATGEEMAKYTSKIRTSAARMSNLIKDLLEFSRISREGLVYQPTDLNTVLKNVSDDFEMLILQKDAAITIDALPSVEANALQMNQLFYNLLANALKFTRKGVKPRITITSRPARKEEMKRLPNGSTTFCCITVADNGIGFPSNFHEKIFTIFQRLNGSDFEGTGIGLALCKRIALAHGGDIWGESPGESGAKFSVLLPVPRQHDGQ